MDLGNQKNIVRLRESDRDIHKINTHARYLIQKDLLIRLERQRWPACMKPVLQVGHHFDLNKVLRLN